MSRNNEAASRIVNRMRQEGSALNGFEMTMAEVTSINPVRISYNNTNITEGIVLSGCLQTETDMEELLESEAGLSQGFKTALKEVISSVKLSAGDSVVVQRVNDTFYIVGKVNP